MYAEHESRKMYVSGAKHVPELAFLAAMHASSSEAFPMFTEYNIYIEIRHSLFSIINM